MRLLRIWLLGSLFLASVGAFGQATEVLCNDNVDNDGDGVKDCADSNCVFAANIEKGCRCYDGLDNDNDTRIDKADPDCATYYGLTFVGAGSNCSIVPPGASSPFTGMANPIVSGQNTADTQSKVAVGDVDGDGIPDAVITSKWNSEVRVVASRAHTVGGTTYAPGDIKSDFKTTGQGAAIFPGAADKKDPCEPKNLLFEHEVLIADIDKDKKAEIFCVVSNRQGNPDSPPNCYFLLAFRYAKDDLVVLPGYPIAIGVDRPGTPGIADFDGDGKAEVYLKNRIYAAENGTLLANPPGNWDSEINSAPVAVNMTGDSNMELVCGNLIYSVPSLSSRTLQTLTIFKDMNTIGATKCYPRVYNDATEYGLDNHSSTSVADIDEDGFIDVLISGSTIKYPAAQNTAVVYWNVQKAIISSYLPPDNSVPTPYVAGWPWGTGRINIGDSDGDNDNEISFIAGSQLFNMEFTPGNRETLVTTPKWIRTIKDSRSGILTVTIYDFDNDAKPEMVYRDSEMLTVIDGATGGGPGGPTDQEWWAQCYSHTYTEGPIIADVNGDGATDICVPCFRNDSFSIDQGIQQQALGEIRMFFSSSNSWLPTRKVWNQPGYFVVNINDDLSLPFPQLDQNMIFGTAACPNGLVGPQRPLNIFLNQVPNLSAGGCPVFPAPDLTYVGDTPNPTCTATPTAPGCDTDGDGVYTPAVVVIPPICGNLGIQVYFNIKNTGDLPISDNVPVSFFNGDPTLSPVTAVRLHNTTIAINNLQVGATIQTPTIAFNGPGSAFQLYIVLYNNGSVLPINLTGPSTKECSISNNMYNVAVVPDPITVTIEKLSDNFKCATSAPNTGALRVHIFKGTTEVTDYSPYSFQWYSGIGTSSPMAGKTAYNNTALAEGDYSVVVTEIAKGCTSLPVSANIVRTGSNPTINLSLLSAQTTCSPLNGKVQADIVGGNTGYTFAWYNISLTPLGITGPVANNLASGNYVVLVQTTDGCPPTASAPITVPGPQFPDAQASVLQHVTDCSNLNSGIVKSEALAAGVVQPAAGYTFNWYFYNNSTSTRGSILPGANGTGDTRTALAVGYYQAEIKDNATQCTSPVSPVVQVLSQTVIPDAPTINQLAPQTSCDPLQPNGILNAEAIVAGAVQNPAGFTFEWFKGQNTLPENKVTTVSGVNGKQVNNVAGGGILYTVKVTTPQNCSATKDFLIAENVVKPVVTLAQLTANSICDPANATSQFNGSVGATVTFNGSPVTLPDNNYTFAWFDGTTTATPHAPAPADPKTSTLTGLVDANYTVVVTRTDLFCVSTPDTEPVAKATINPLLLPTSTGSNNCDPLLTPDGTVTVAITNTAASPGPFTYQWFDGGVVGVSPLGATNNGTSATAIKVGGPTGAPKPYTVRVLNTATGCVNNTTQVVADNSVVPLLSTTTVPNSICAPATSFNGSMTVSVTNIPALYTIADYSFAWYDGSTTATSHVPQPSPASSVTLPTLDVGSYSVVGTNTKTGCVSAIATNQVANQKLIPSLVPSSTGSNNCVNDPASGINPDGTVSVAVTVAVGPFNYQWYQGSGNPFAGAGLPVVPAGNNGQAVTATGLGGPVGAPVPYTVLVTDQITGCNNFVTTAVADNSVIPVLSTSTNPNSICAPSTSFSGSMTVGVTNIPVLYTIADYTFTWFDGATSTTQHNPQPSPATSVTLPTLDVGQYSVIGRNTKTGCVSVLATNQVADGKVYPALTPSSTGSNNCVVDPGNGINNDGTATVAVTSPAGPFNYQWYVGTGDPFAGGGLGTVPLANNGQSPTATGLGGPIGAPISYTALVTIQATGCSHYVTAVVADVSSKPILSTSTAPNDICAPVTSFSGSMTVGVTNIPIGYVITDYDFDWYDGSTTATLHATQPAPASAVTLALLDVGTYSVVGTNTKTGCVSVIATNQVADGKKYPLLAPSATGSHNCSTSVPNDGTATVAITGPAVGPFDFQWHVGAGDPTTLPTLVPDLQGGKAILATALGGPTAATHSYTVLVTDQVTKCSAYTAAVVSDISQKPTFTITPTNNPICDITIPGGPTAFGGQVAVTGETHAVAGGTYSYQWYDVDGLGALTLRPANTAATLAQLDNAKYAATITRVEFGCVSDPQTAEVLDAPTPITVTPSIISSTNCAPAVSGNGNVTVTAPVGANIAYQWYNGSVIDPGQLLVGDTDADLGAAGNDIQGGVTSNFVVLVTNLTDGCQKNEPVNVPDAKVTPTISLLATPNTICDLTTIDPDGTLTATVGSAGVNFTIDWTGDAAPAVPDPGDETKLTKAKAGPYSATVTNDDTGCVSAADPATIVDVFTYPVVAVAVQDQTTCSGTPNGMLTALGDGAANTTTHDFVWYDGIGVTPGSEHTQNGAGIIDELASGDYTIEIVIKSTGCSTVRPSFVPNDIVNPALAMNALSPVTICGPIPSGMTPNGSAQAIVTDFSVSPAIDYTVFYVRTVVVGPVGVGSFPTDADDIRGSAEFYDAGAAPPAISNLAPGYLTALVVDNNTQCESTPATVQILNATADYSFQINGVAVAGLCNPTNPGGQIDITVLKDPPGAAPPAACGTCTYEWFAGTPTNQNINFFNNPPVFATPVIVTTEDITLVSPVGGVSAGTYTIKVIDTSNGCGDFESQVIPTANPATIATVLTPPTECVTPSNPDNNGDIAVTVTKDVTNTLGYTVNIYSGNQPILGNRIFAGVLTTASPFTVNKDLLDNGDYLVEVIDETAVNKPCPQRFQKTLTGTAFSPQITIDNIDPNTSCDPNLAADGAVTLTVDKDASDTSTPSYFITGISPTPVGFVLPAPPGLPVGGTGASVGPISGFKPEDEVPEYTITVTDNVSKCFNEIVVTVPDQVSMPTTFAITPTPETMCAPATNGSALAVIDGAPAVATQYDFEWYEDGGLTTIANGGIAVPKPGDGTSGTGGGGELLNASRIVAPSVWATGTTGQGSGNRVYFGRAKKNATATSGVGCYTAAVQVSINDTHVSPDMALTPKFDSFCAAGLTPGDGSITVVADEIPGGAQQIPAGGFTYDWDTVPTGLAIAPVNSAVASFPINDLADAVYQVTVMNATNQCTVVNNVTIAPAPYVISVNTHTLVDQRICLPDGDITLTQITVDRSADPTAGGNIVEAAAVLDASYDFKWYKAAAGTPGTFDPTPGQELKDNVFPAAPVAIDIRTLGIDTDLTPEPGEYQDMGVGTYYVVGTRAVVGAVGFGCPTLPYRVDIADTHKNPVPALTVLSNTSCLPAGPGEGEILITVADTPIAPFTPGGGYTFTYTWPGPGPIPTPFLPLGATNAVPGAGDGDGSSADGDDDHYRVLLDNPLPYLVTIENDQTGCFANASATIVKNATPVFVQNVTVTDEILCSATGDGSITVTKVSMNDRNGANLDFVAAPTGLQGDIADFDFEWKRGTSGPLTTTGTVLDNTTYVTPTLLPSVIGAGTYTVTAKRSVGTPGAGCPSAPFTVTIIDRKILPVVTMTPFSNTSCSANPLLQEGEITIKALDNSTAPAPATPGFTYVWGTNPTAIPAAAFPAANDGDGFGTGDTDATPAVDNDEDHARGLMDGAYTLTVQSNKSGCSTSSSTTILKNALPIFVQDVTVTNQLICGPDGSLTVSTVSMNDRTGTTTVFNGASTPNISDFQFTWQRAAAAGSQTTAGTALNLGTYLPASFGGTPIGFDTYTVRAQRISGGPGNGCLSTPFDVDILDRRIFPVVTLTPFANTSCSSNPADLEGEISVRVVDNTPVVGPNAFTYTWSGSNPSAIAAAAFPAPNDGDSFGSGDTDLTPAVDNDEDHPKTLAEGVYNMTVQSNKSLCIVTAQTQIFKNSTPVFTQLVVPTDQVLCTADGRLVVNEVRVIDRTGTIQSSLTDFPISDFDFRYSRTSVAGVLPGITAAQLDITNYPTIGADVYFVVATRVNGGPGFGCSSPEYKVDIQNKQIVPIVSLTPLANTSCDPLFFEGEIEVRVQDNSINLPAPLAPPFTYSYNWTVSATPAVLTGPVAGVHDGDGLGGGDADGAGTDNDGDHPLALMEGDYTVSVTNTITGCASIGSTTIFKNSTPVFTQLVLATPQVLCNPDGTLQVQEVRVIDRDGNIESNLTGDFPLSDFAFRYDRGTIGNTVVANSDPAQPVSLLNNITYSAIGIDEYYVFATRVAGGPGLDCISAPYKVDIEDRRLYPDASFTSIANSSCSALKPNGSVTVSASEQDGTSTDPYTFVWTLDGGALAPTSTQTDTSPTSVIGNALDGDYVATITNTATGCPYDAGFILILDPTRSTPNIIDVLTVDPLNCLPTASAEVTRITLGSDQNSTLFPPNVPPNNEISGPALSAFIYSWFDGTLTNQIPGASAPLISTLVPGTFFVNVQDPTTDCVSGPKEVIISDVNIIYPIAEILQTAKQISCTSVGTAALLGTGDGQDDTNPDYTFEWFPSLDLTGTRFATTSTAPNLTVGDYSVEVTRISTGCKASALYIVPDDAPGYSPVVSLGGQPRTLCVGTDGALLSRVVNIQPDYPFPFDFTSDGYNGATPNLAATPDYPAMPNVPGFAESFEQTGLNEGVYTVRITDNNTGCIGIATESVADNRTLPVVAIFQENPLTVCPPVVNPNGQLSASADGRELGYNYTWYAGATVTTPPGTVLSSINKLIGAPAGPYVVRVVHAITGCQSDLAGMITDEHITPPTPDPTVEHHLTNCVSPNGWVTSTVGGVTFNYTFNWYDGSALKPSSDFVGVDYNFLDAGNYTVTATDDVTGCVSGPGTVEVLDQRLIPEFTITTTPSFCVDTGLPKGTGSAILEVTNPDILVQDVQWTDVNSGGSAGSGIAIYEIFPSIYSAHVITVEGCENTGQAEVGTEISPYNGVSNDNDGLNEIFVVDCISLFPDNNVKIFNRNGIKVFEADGYNNTTVAFGGDGEKGVYLQGIQLPAGTYFYIIDKRDGSKPIAGYLELDR